MRQMSAMRQVKAHKSISGLKNCHQHCHICLGTGVWLYVCPFGPKKCFGTVNGNLFSLIHYLATALDDVADYIYASCKKIQFHGVDPNDQGIQKMAEVISQSAAEVGKAVMQLRELKHPEKITESLVKINSMENHADDIFDMSIKKLFETENDFKELIRRREVYTVMEVATDKCEDVANVIESIIVKYA